MRTLLILAHMTCVDEGMNQEALCGVVVVLVNVVRSGLFKFDFTEHHVVASLTRIGHVTGFIRRCDSTSAQSDSEMIPLPLGSDPPTATLDPPATTI